MLSVSGEELFDPLGSLVSIFAAYKVVKLNRKVNQITLLLLLRAQPADELPVSFTSSGGYF